MFGITVCYNFFTGHPVQYKQSDIGIKGWAVESRVYAEVRKFIDVLAHFKIKIF